jgi:hypothetical protein
MNQNKKIIFVTYGGGHVNMLVPIIKELQKKDNLKLVVLGLTTAGLVLKKNNIPYIGFKDLLEFDNHYARKLGVKLVNKDSLHPSILYEEAVAYIGLSYVDLENEFGNKKAAELYKEQGRQIFNPFFTMRKFLHKESPDLLIATNSPRAESAAFSAAKDLGIPSICLVDLFALREAKRIGVAGYASKICVLSQVVKDTLVKLGGFEKDIIVTGNSAFDALLEYRDRSAYFKEKFNFNRYHKVILWISQQEPVFDFNSGRRGDSLLPRKVEKELIGIAKKNPYWKIIFRQHPNEMVNYDYLPENILISNPKVQLPELLSAVDVVVTMTSTVGLEAIILDKQLITIDLSIFKEYMPYSKMGLSYGINDLGKLEDAILSVTTNRIKEKSTLCFGSATNNILSIIKGCLNSKYE